MTMLRFDPFRGFETMMKKMSEVAADLERGVVIEKGSFAPRVDIYEDDANMYLNAELAGLKREDISIKLNEGNVLVLSGKKDRGEEDEKRTIVRNERSFGEFSRSVVLPDNLDLDSIKASYRDGVLEIKISKKLPDPPKEINISID